MIETEQVFMQTLNGLRRRRDEFNAAIASMEKLAGLKPGEGFMVLLEDQREDKVLTPPEECLNPVMSPIVPPAPHIEPAPTVPPRIPCPKEGCKNSGVNLNSLGSHIHQSHYNEREILRFKAREWYRINILEKKVDAPNNGAPKAEASTTEPSKQQFRSVVKPCIQDPRIVKKGGNFVSVICGNAFLRVQDRYGHDKEFHPDR